ncbi:MAG: thioesterase family protein [Sciscionella sp.]
MGEAFYQRRDEHTFVSTGHTAGPWSADTQHFGPPSALLARALEGVPAARDMMLARVSVDILGPLPVAELEVSAKLERPGRSVELVSAALCCAGRAVATARGWRIVRSNTADVAEGESTPLPDPDQAAPYVQPEHWRSGYLDVMEWRALSGGFGTAGPASLWCRQRVDLVEGEEPTSWQRTLAVADSGNGISGLLDPREWYFINTELTVHLHREPVGEWIGLDAATVIGPHGIGTTSSNLHDRSGQIGRAAQALLVRRR